MRNLNLVLHTGAWEVKLDELQKVATPAPSGIWRPIPHATLLAKVVGSMERSGLRVVTESHAVAHDGARYFGLLQMANGHNADDYGLVVGLRNSHDKSFPAGLCVGSGVFVCDNLSFSGEVTIARKHTTNLERDLPRLIEAAVGKLGDVRRHQDERIAAYKATEISDARAHDLLIQSMDVGVLPVTRLPQVLREWRTPSHPEFGQRNVWRLMNAFTEVAKDTNLFSLPRSTQALHGLLDTVSGLAAVPVGAN